MVFDLQFVVRVDSPHRVDTVLVAGGNSMTRRIPGSDADRALVQDHLARRVIPGY